MAASLKDLGRYGEAYRLADETWERLAEDKAYGPSHPTTLKLSDLLAVLDRVFGRYADALERDRQITEAYRRIRGEEHVTTLQARNNLAVSRPTRVASHGDTHTCWPPPGPSCWAYGRPGS